MTASSAAARPPQRLPVRTLALAWRQARRDLRAGELRLLIVAVVLAVAALTAVGFFADRLDRGLKRDARALLGGDLVLASDQPAPATFAEQARAMGLTSAVSASFPSMARAPDARGGATRLAAVKAVSERYPLRGTLRLRDAAGRETEQAAAPAPGTAWVDAALLDALGLKLGDRLALGDAELRIERVIVLEPDRGAGFMSFAPRVLLRDVDLPATGLVQPASRITWRLAVAGADTAVGAFRAWAADEMDSRHLRGARQESLDSGRPEMRQTLKRASRFLDLVALLAALLSAVAVAIAARDFAQRHLDEGALLRVLGAPQRAIAGAYALEFGSVGLAASAAGVALGWAVHHVFVQLLAGLVSAELPAPGWRPALFGLGVGLTLLIAFGLPPVLQLARVPALRVLRRDLGAPRAASVGVLVAGTAGFAALLYAVAGDPRLGALAVGGFAAAVAVFALGAWAAVALLRRGVHHPALPRWWVLATRQLASRPGFAVLQVSALSVGLLALALLVLVRTDLIDSWRRATPPDAPDRFVINLQPDQADAFRERLAQAGVRGYDWYPMVRGRLVAINGRAVAETDYGDERARRLVEREFNLSHDAVQPAHNRIVAGEWRAADDGLSVEEGLAKTLGLKLGDTLRFDIGGQPQEGRITSLRKVDWGSMRVNFFVLFTRAQLPEGLPVTYISAFRSPDPKQQPGFDNALVRAFPNITAIDVGASLAQVQRVLDQVIRAVEFLFGFTLAAGLAVLFAAVAATRETRSREYAVMRALGAGRVLLARVQRAELLGVGALAGAMASGAALVVGALLARFVFEFEWRGSLWVPLAGTAAGALLALAAGGWGLRELLRRPVMATLRRADD